MVVRRRDISAAKSQAEAEAAGARAEAQKQDAMAAAADGLAALGFTDVRIEQVGALWRVRAERGDPLSAVGDSLAQAVERAVATPRAEPAP